jgi:hypothetical protein
MAKPATRRPRRPRVIEHEQEMPAHEEDESSGYEPGSESMS